MKLHSLVTVALRIVGIVELIRALEMLVIQLRMLGVLASRVNPYTPREDPAITFLIAVGTPLVIGLAIILLSKPLAWIICKDLDDAAT